MQNIYNGDDVVDSRDVEERIEELEQERDDLVDIRDEASEALEDAEPEDHAQAEADLEEAVEALTEWDNSAEGSELNDLKAFRDEVNSSEWTYGLTLIHATYWVEYVEEMLIDIGDLPQDIPHYIVIDWDQTADNIQVDYSEADINGNTYYYRDC